MSIFYINAEKDLEGKEFQDKYDFAKFIDMTSDVPAETKQRVRTVINQDNA